MLIRATDPDAMASFTTYKNYLVNLEHAILGSYGPDPYPSLVATVRGRDGFKRISQRQDLPVAELHTSLRIAWVKELQLRLPSQYGVEQLPALAQGSAHLAYYSVYHAARALLFASGQQVRDTHATVLRSLGTVVIQRKLFPFPWSGHCLGGPDGQGFVFGGMPGLSGTRHAIHNLSRPTPEAMIEWLQLCLSSTRAKQIEIKKTEWREKNGRKKVPAAETSRIVKNLTATTLFDFLWRLRTRSDYKDADAFLEGVATGSEANAYYKAISQLVAGTLAVLETDLVAYTGGSLYEEASTRFIRQTHGTGVQELALRRMAIIGRSPEPLRLSRTA